MPIAVAAFRRHLRQSWEEGQPGSLKGREPDSQAKPGAKTVAQSLGPSSC